MPSRLPVFSIAILIFAAGCASTPKHSEPVAYSTEDWTFHNDKGMKLTTPHYEIYTTAKHRSFVNALPTFLECCWDAYAELLPATSTPSEHLACYFFQSRREWEKFTEQFTPARAETYKCIRSGGYTERGVTVSYYDTARSAASVLAHEGLHQFLEVTRDGKAIPAWVNEGLACYFEAFDLDSKNRPHFKPDTNTLRMAPLRDAIIAKQLIPLHDLLATHAGLEIQKASTHVSSYYAQIWSLVVFLMRPAAVNPYHDGFRLLMRELGTESMNIKARGFLAADTAGTMSHGEAVFRAYVTDDLEKFESQYRDFIEDFLKMRN